MDRIERIEKIYWRIKEGNYSLCFYYHYQAELENLLLEAREA